MTIHEQTFLKLVRENDQRLRRICRVYAPSAEAREDLYQDILMQLWRSLPLYKADAQASTWIYRVALNTAMTSKRAGVSRRESLHDSLNESHELWRDGAPAPDECLDAQQQRERLYGAIGRLGDLDKALVTLFLDETSYRDIADVLGISENHVGVKLHRIKKALAILLDEEDS